MLSKDVYNRVKQYKGNSFKPLREINLVDFRKSCEAFYEDLSSEYPCISSKDFDFSTCEKHIKYRKYSFSKKINNHCIIYIFAGGFIEGGLNSQDAICRYISSKCQTDVISISYRLAPENKYPSAHNDVFFAIDHILHSISSYSGYSLVGYSSGGNLALSSICKAIKQKHNKFKKIKNIILISPFLNLDQDESNQIDGVMLDVKDLFYMAKLYTSGCDIDLKSSNLSPFYEKGDVLSQLPKTHILSAAFDPLSYDCYKFYRRILSLGVDSSFHEYNMIHLEFALSATILANMNDNPLNQVCRLLIEPSKK